MKAYVGPIVTTDAVVLQRRDNALWVLTLVRERAPFARVRALPGVYVARGETINHSVDRCLKQKIGFVLPSEATRNVVDVYDSIGRDPRGHSISVVTCSIVPSGQDAVGEWRQRSEVGELAFDHNDMLNATTRWLMDHVWDRAILKALVGCEALTTSTFVKIAEAVGLTSNASNLRRRLVATGHVIPTRHSRADGPGRPSVVWKWSSDHNTTSCR